MNVGPWQLLIIALVILVLFGRGRISEMMGDFGKGIKSFKEGMKEGGETPAAPPRIESGTAESNAAETPSTKSADNQPTSN